MFYDLFISCLLNIKVIKVSIEVTLTSSLFSSKIIEWYSIFPLKIIDRHVDQVQKCNILQVSVKFYFNGCKNWIPVLREKGRDLTQSYDKNPYTNRNVKKAQ